MSTDAGSSRSGGTPAPAAALMLLVLVGIAGAWLLGTSAAPPARAPVAEVVEPATVSEAVALAPAAESAAALPVGEGEDWPIFLGPRGTSISAETGLIDEFGVDGPPRLWHRKLGEGYAPPSIRGERLIVHHRQREEEFVECLDAKTGETKWRTGYPTSFADPYGYNGGSRCAPLLTADRCYTFGPQGKLLCLELETGKKVWERDTNKDWTVPDHFFGFGCTPILEGNQLIVLVGGQPNSAVVSFDAATGKTLWEAGGQSTWDGIETDKRGTKLRWSNDEMLVSYSSPIVATIHGQKHLLCLLRQGLASFNPQDGSLNFRYWFRSRIHESVNAARPIVVGDTIFLSAAYDTGAALLRVKPDGKSFDEVWRKPRGMSTHWSTPVVVDGHAYGFSGRHESEAQLQCVHLESGELQWETNGFSGDLSQLEQDPNSGRIRDKQTQKPVPWPYYGRGSAVLADGKFYVLGERGTLAIVQPSPEKFVEVCRANIADIGYPSWAAPIVSRGRMFLRAEEHVVALDVAKPPAK